MKQPHPFVFMMLYLSELKASIPAVRYSIDHRDMLAAGWGQSFVKTVTL